MVVFCNVYAVEAHTVVVVVPNVKDRAGLCQLIRRRRTRRRILIIMLVLVRMQIAVSATRTR